MARASQEIDKWVGRRISEIRREAGLSQSALAASLDLSFQQIQKYEAGQNRLSAGRLFELASILKCQIADPFPVTAHVANTLPSPAIGNSVEGRILAEHFPRIQDRAVRRSVAHIVEVLALG